MGSDLYLEQQSWRPRASYGEWDGDDLIIYKDKFYTGYEEVWRGPVTDSNESLILTMIKNIPEKPKPEPIQIVVEFTPEEYIRALKFMAFQGYKGMHTLMKDAALGMFYSKEGWK